MTTEAKQPRFETALVTNVGVMTVAWSLLDHLLSSCIIWLTRIDTLDGIIMTDRMTVVRKLDVIKTLIKTKGFDEKALEDFEKLADDIRKASTKRNTIAHGMWLDGTAPGAVAPTIVRTFGSLQVISGDITSDDVKHLNTDIMSLSTNLLDFASRYGISKIPEKETAPTPPPQSV